MTDWTWTNWTELDGIGRLLREIRYLAHALALAQKNQKRIFFTIQFV